jgi:hypothetical protein
MSAGRLKSGDEPSGRDGKDSVEHSVYRMRRIPLHVQIGTLAGEHGLLPCWRYARRAGQPLKLGCRVAP